MKMQPVEYTQGCSDGACVLRIGPVGQHTNGGCRCLRDVPTDLRIKIMRKFAYERARLADAEAERGEFRQLLRDVLRGRRRFMRDTLGEVLFESVKAAAGDV